MPLKNDHYTYRVTWSEKDREYIGLCAEFPSLSWLSKTGGYQDPQSIRFCDSISKLLKKACEINRHANDTNIQPGIAEARIHRLYSLLNSMCMTKLSDKNAETLRKRLLDPGKEHERLFTFLKYPDVEPTNNQAEQSLRNLVIFRKICFGTRSADGSRSHSVLPSLVLTAKRQNQHLLKFLQTLFTSATATAQKALFNNTS